MIETTTTVPAASANDFVVQDDTSAGIARARDTARAFADSLEPALPTETAQTLVLLVSELTTNALRHGGGRYTMGLDAAPDTVHISVSDASPSAPRVRAPDLRGGTGGCGWHMIRRLACGVAVTRGPGEGKTVHVHLPR
ncbi:ATP-binding protein [Streptomyces sp. B1I3]|uniref:ATP-binding protein n=1 Tax=Streptomyces sp. B1I3 TaxID=3042264 RepID=UPI0027D8F65A|nr:ATP-binding protein [Streptomyces sp. B1I3]